MTSLALRRSLRRDSGGLAMVEFGLMLPIFVLMCVGGSELANYITIRMRMSQIALQIADNAARMGTGSKLAAKTVSETDINDVFAGAQIESNRLDLKTNGRVILSDLENNPAKTNESNAYKIGWQRCYGSKTSHPATNYGRTGDIVPFMGSTARPTMVLPDNASMFVEVYYVYKPIISSVWVPSTEMVETASMAVRDRRNLTAAIENTAAATIASC